MRLAREIVGPDEELPEPSEADNVVIDTFNALNDPRLYGGTWGYFTLRCDALGLDTHERLEVWRRSGIVDAIVRDYQAQAHRAVVVT